ncbi:MAG: type I restriction endonuclease [Leptolyngbyaceae cyanobacterium bins.349]|nr:type I restriction endonuclease [Leptolyngbyaceae cyanobacterium bins.349]
MDTSEKNVETQIEQHLTTHGYTQRQPQHFDPVNALDPEMLFDFLYATQLATWKKLEQHHGAQVKERFLKRLAQEIETRGTLDVLRKGVIDLGCKFELAYFKPEDTLNPDHQRLYNANILSIMRQVHYSPKDTNKSLDLVLLLNGLPIFTAELKNPLTGQTVEDAIWQYRKTRNPNDPILKFGRCLAHFAVDTDLVYMTTHLKADETRFLPFNQGNDKAAGNPTNPNGFKTAYLWEQIWQRDSLLDILNNFVQLRDIEDDKGNKTGKKAIIFPRYHQLDAVRRLVNHAQTSGTGHSYLIQHSAGSGKSETIAWLSLRLSSLKHLQADNAWRRVFDSILVITDRKNLDQQLQRTIRGFVQVTGVVTAIKNNKSSELAKALERGDDVIITTLQTFKFAVEKMTSLKGRKFAVIIDEAHSSQSGEGKDAVKKVLSFNQPIAAEPTGDYQVIDASRRFATDPLAAAAQAESEPEPDAEDEINTVVTTQQQQKGRSPHISYFAFTATPKPKTLETFGIRVDLPDGKPNFVPFSLYSMRQAIDEGFILDVLQDYTTYTTYFNLIKQVTEDPHYDKGKAAIVLKSYADIHDHAIASKTEIMVDHFHQHIANLIDGQAKAMIVTRSRLHAVRYKFACDRYLKEKGYPYRALVAFTGGVVDPDTPLPDPYTESKLNGHPDSQTVEIFRQQDYRFLIVARKFQTGFNQPLLQTMYVDKRLGGVEAVQTLSRLNRIYPSKEKVFVLDFANEADEIQAAFQPYYQATILSEATDPNKLYDLKRTLEGFHLFTAPEVETFARAYFPTKANPNPNQAKLHPILNPIVENNYQQQTPENKAAIRKRLGDYIRTYAFLVHIITFTDAELEKFYQFARWLLKKLPIDRDRLPTDLTDHINMDSYRIQQTSAGQIRLLTEDGELVPLSGLGTGRPTVENLAPLSEILTYINEHFDPGDWSAKDKLSFFADDMNRRLARSEGLARALDPTINPSEETRKLAFETYFKEILEDMIDTNFEIYQKLSDDSSFGELFRQVMFTNFLKYLDATRNRETG